jgi:hypothetical protein
MPTMRGDANPAHDNVVMIMGANRWLAERTGGWRSERMS